MAKQPQKSTLAALVKKQGDGDFLLVAQKTKLTRKGKELVQISWAVSADFVLEPNAAVLVERISDYMLAAHRVAIKAGKKADGSGNQKPLDSTNRGGAWRRAEKGIRPKTRGAISGTMADNLTRGKISIKEAKSSFQKKRVFGPQPKRQARALVAEARATISVVNVDARASLPDAHLGPNKGQYVPLIQAEATRGVTYHYVEGDIEAGVSVILDQFLEAVIEGTTWKKIKGNSEQRAKRAKF